MPTVMTVSVVPMWHRTTGLVVPDEAIDDKSAEEILDDVFGDDQSVEEDQAVEDDQEADASEADDELEVGVDDA